MFTVTLNAVGCLPDSDSYPCQFDTAREAWDHVASEVECIADDGDYLAAHTALHLQNRDSSGVIPADETGFYNFLVFPTH